MESTEIDKLFDEYNDAPDTIIYKNNPHKSGKLLLEVDASYAYDFLSIYEVKEAMHSTDKQAALNSDMTEEFLIRQLGKNFHDLIVESDEYQNLLEINLELYRLVDMVKTEPHLGKEVDMAVFKRRLSKIALQEKFFPNTKISEQKFGYEKV